MTMDQVGMEELPRATLLCLIALNDTYTHACGYLPHLFVHHPQRMLSLQANALSIADLMTLPGGCLGTGLVSDQRTYGYGDHGTHFPGNCNMIYALLNQVVIIFV